MGVSTGGLHSEHTAFHRQDAHIEGTASKIKNHYIGLILLSSTIDTGGMKTVGKSSGSRFINNTHYIETSNSTSILGRLTLLVIKMGRNSDDSFFNALTESSFSGSLHFEKNHGGHFFR
mmetsp:Transcript_6193/g.10358  ORF Transcript_6193/g.10358 Transcript_6193/m.10358 type:complete len:119 (+) Transcript_6193:1560-1916(+)